VALRQPRLQLNPRRRCQAIQDGYLALPEVQVRPASEAAEEYRIVAVWVLR